RAFTNFSSLVLHWSSSNASLADFFPLPGNPKAFIPSLSLTHTHTHTHTPSLSPNAYSPLYCACEMSVACLVVWIGVVIGSRERCGWCRRRGCCESRA